MNLLRRSVFVAAGAFAAAQALSVPEARADVIWTLHNVVFDDGGSVANGTFTLNIDGYLTQSSISVTTTAGTMSNGTGGPLAGDTYNADMVAGNINNVGGTGLPDDTVTFFSSTLGYEGTLNLQFQYALTAPVAMNPILGGAPGPSWECAVGFDCPDVGVSGTPIRYVTGGYASGAVPEPPVWAMMTVGAGLLAFWKSRRRIECRAA
jgi:hypothetical protein